MAVVTVHTWTRRMVFPQNVALKRDMFSVYLDAHHHITRRVPRTDVWLGPWEPQNP